MRLHKFEVFVRTFENKETARLALLCAFSKRDPDRCEFYLKRPASKKAKKGGAA